MTDGIESQGLLTSPSEHGEATQNLRRQLRRMRRERDEALAELDADQARNKREIETLTALNKSQAGRIELLLEESKMLLRNVKQRDKAIEELTGLVALWTERAEAAAHAVEGGYSWDDD